MELPLDVVNLVYNLCDIETRFVFTFINKYWKDRKVNTSIRNVYDQALEENNVSLLIWTLNYYIGSEYPPEFTGEIFEMKVAESNYEMLELLHKYNCPYNHNIFNREAYIGNIPMLEWALSHNYGFDTNICVSAAEGLQRETLVWLRLKQFPINYYVLKAAIGTNNDDFIIFTHNLVGNNYYDMHNYPLDIPLMSGNLHVMKLLHSLGYNIGPSSMRIAFNKSRLDLISYIKEIGGVITRNLMIQGIKTSDIELIDWILKNTDQIPKNICQYTSNKGVIAILKSYGYE
jgi:hypothetical protein